jgi:predicted dehydrogenase
MVVNNSMTKTDRVLIKFARNARLFSWDHTGREREGGADSADSAPKLDRTVWRYGTGSRPGRRPCTAWSLHSVSLSPVTRPRDRDYSTRNFCSGKEQVMVKVGIIGCGGMGNYHGPELVKLRNVEVVGTCDLVADKAKALAERIGVDRHGTDFRTLLPDVDAVWVCTEPFNRVDVVTAAAAAGKHIFTEKPIARSLADADAMIAAARKARVTYMLGYCLRFWQPYRLMRDTAARGELGDVVSCWMRRCMPWVPPNWYGLQEKSGGVMLDFGSHDVDWLRWVGGDVRTVFGKTFRSREKAAADDHGAAVFLFESGAVGTIENSWSSRLGDSTVGIIGTKGAMFLGNDGKVRRCLADGPEELVDVEAATAVDPKGNIGVRGEDGRVSKVANPNESIQQHFFRCIEEGITPLTAATDGRKTLLTVMALWESTRTGRSVRVRSMSRTRRQAQGEAA